MRRRVFVPDRMVPSRLRGEKRGRSCLYLFWIFFFCFCGTISSSSRGDIEHGQYEERRTCARLSFAKRRYVCCFFSFFSLSSFCSSSYLHTMVLVFVFVSVAPLGASKIIRLYCRDGWTAHERTHAHETRGRGGQTERFPSAPLRDNRVLVFFAICFYVASCLAANIH